MKKVKKINEYHNEKEHSEENYMLFSNIQNIKRMIDEMVSMPKEEVDKIISNGHNWAADHISTSKDDIEEVFNFLKSALQKG